MEDRMFAEHYGPYGTACINTGQFDAGECWKCQIKRLEKELDTARKVIVIMHEDKAGINI